MSERVERPDDFSQVVQELLAQPAQEYTLPRVVELAVERVPGCEFAGVSLRRGKGKVDTPACTDPVVQRLDAAQYDLNQGPCLDAIRQQDAVIIDDSGSDPRWPQWGPVAAGLGVLSVLAVRLATPEHVVGALNLFSRNRYAFDQDAVQVAHRFAESASTAVAVAEQVEGLRTAMSTRHQIGMAQGMLMLRYGLDEDQAFQFLARISQQRNIKLHQIASQVIGELIKHGWPREP